MKIFIQIQMRDNVLHNRLIEKRLVDRGQKLTFDNYVKIIIFMTKIFI